jgi:hypothetical protein
LTNDIFVQNNSSQPLKVLDASVNVPGVDVAVKVLTPDQNYTIVLAFPQGFQIPSGQAMKATIKTDNPRYPTLEVPIMQLQAPQRRPLAALPVAPPAAPSAKN